MDTGGPETFPEGGGKLRAGSAASGSKDLAMRTRSQGGRNHKLAEKRILQSLRDESACGLMSPGRLPSEAAALQKIR